MANNLNDKIDSGQVIKSVYDTDDNSLRVSVVSGSGGGGGVSVEIDAAEDSIAIGDGTKLATITTVGPKNGLDVNVINNPLNVIVSNEVEVKNDSGNPIPVSGTVDLGTIGNIATETTLSALNTKVVAVNTNSVTVVSSVLPTGASTSANQTIANTTLTSLLNELQQKTEPTDTQPISAVSLPLPTGASTSALQTTGNASLSSIDSKLTSPLIVQATDLDIRNLTFAQDKIDASGSSVSVSNFPVTQPVSGTVALDSTTLAALESITVQNPAGASAVNIQDGGNSITVDGSISVSNFPATQNVNVTNSSLAVTGPLTDTQLRASAVPVSAASLPLPSGASTSALQTSGNSSLSSIDTKTPALGQALAAASVPVVLPAAQIATLTPPTTVTITQATGTNLHAVIDSGSVSISGTANVNVTNASIAVTGPLTDTQLRASAVPVTANAGTNLNTSALNLETTQSAINTKLPSGLTVKAASTAAVTTDQALVVAISPNNPITLSGEVEIKNDSGNPIPVNGTVTANLGTIAGVATETTLSAINNKVPANLTVTATRLLVDGSGVTQPVSATSLPLPTGASTSALQTAGNASLTSIDSKLTSPLAVTGPLTDTQLRASAVPVSGTVTSNIGTTNGLALDTTLTSGTQKSIVRGGAKGTTTAADVTSTNVDANTQALDVSIKGTSNVAVTSSVLPTGASTSALQTTGNTSLSSIDGKVPANLTVTSTRLLVDGSGVTQPVSASSLPLPAGAATEATLSALNTKVPTGLTVKAASTAAVATDQALVVAISPNNTINATLTNSSIEISNDVGNPIPVSGTVAISGTIPVSGPLTDTQLRASAVPVSGTVTSNIGTTNGLALDTSVNSLLKPASTLAAVTTVGSITNTVIIKADTAVNQTNALKVDGSAVTQPVSAVSLPLPTGASTSALQTSGNASLSSLDTKTPSLGQATMAASSPVTIASNQSALAVTGTFFQATQPVSATSLPLPTGAATETTLSALNTKVPSGLTVKAASTAAVVGDQSLVVALSPNSPVPAGTNIIGAVQNASGQNTIALSAIGDFFLQGNMLKYSGMYFEVTGTWVGTIQALGSTDGGTTYNSLPVIPINQIQGTAVTSITSNGLYYFPIYTDAIRVSMTAYTSGTATTRLAYTTNNQNPAQNVLLAQIATNTGAQSVDTLQTGTISALNGNVAINAQGSYTVSARIAGTWVASLVAEGLMADGTTWQQVPMYIISSTLPYASTFTQTTNSNVLITGGGYTQVRIRASAYTSGTVTVNLNASLAQQTIASSQLGNWTVNSVPLDGNKTSYSVSIIGLNAVNTATDIFTITGSATKTIKVTRIALTATQTTAAQRDIAIIKRSTANTAGTSTTPTIVAHDSTNAAATAVVRAYTANPTLGTIVGLLRARKVFIGTATGNSDELIIEPGNRPSQAFTLRGTGEVLSINLNSVTSAGNSFDINIEWTEES